ncbi:MAG: response regulator [Chitinophagaceae bacterium]|nr:response regulator [Chitinophagaceae bacterium]
MKRRDEQHVVIIDDDPVSNMLTEMSIKSVHSKDYIRSYVNPTDGIDHIAQLVNQNEGEQVIAFVDINMPGLSGWEVIEHLEPMIANGKAKGLRIYMLSSSINTNDKLKAYNIPIVSGYFEKPLSSKDFSDLIFKSNYL